MTEAHYRQQGFPHAFMQLPGVDGWGNADSGRESLIPSLPREGHTQAPAKDLKYSGHSEPSAAE
jgi:hypothetical protein